MDEKKEVVKKPTGKKVIGQDGKTGEMIYSDGSRQKFETKKLTEKQKKDPKLQY